MENPASRGRRRHQSQNPPRSLNFWQNTGQNRQLQAAHLQKSGQGQSFCDKAGFGACRTRQKGSLGASKSTHYEFFFNVDCFYNLCYTFPWCTTRILLVPPIFCANLEAYGASSMLTPKSAPHFHQHHYFLDIENSMNFSDGSCPKKYLSTSSTFQPQETYEFFRWTMPQKMFLQVSSS